MGVEDSLKVIILCLKINSLKTRALVVKVCFANQGGNTVIHVKIIVDQKLNSSTYFNSTYCNILKVYGEPNQNEIILSRMS